eukprot:INCI4672.1.p1 GENE.INCI4672.1~~INCI4672.1.p1  ORF type:complete len:322 (-),score=62.83 INCI4672.1:31-996(-)
MSSTFFSDAHNDTDRTQLPVLSGYFLQEGQGFWGWVVNATFSMVRWKFSRFSKIPDIAAVSPDEQHDLSQAQNLQLHRNFMGIHGAAVVSFDTPTANVQLHVAGNKNNVEVAMQWVSNLSQRINWAQSHDALEEDVPRQQDEKIVEEILQSTEAAADPADDEIELVEPVDLAAEKAVHEVTISTATVESIDLITAIAESQPRESPIRATSIESALVGELATSMIDAEVPVKESSALLNTDDGEATKSPSAPSKKTRRVSSVSSLLKARRNSRGSSSRPRQARASAIRAAAAKIVYAKPKPAAAGPRPVMQAAAAKTFDFSF